MTTRPGISQTVPGSSVIQATDPRVLDVIFKRVPIEPDDVLVDLGCGDGDVIAFWLALGIKNAIVGIELDQPTAASTAARFAGNDQVTIIEGDATLGEPGGTLFYMFNPFRGEQMMRLEGNLRAQPARVIYNAWHDLEIFAHWGIDLLRPRPDEIAFRACVLYSPAMLTTPLRP